VAGCVVYSVQADQPDTKTWPADASVASNITTSNGTAKVEGSTNVNYLSNEAKYKTGTIGIGAAAVTLRSENGNVTIQVR